MGDDNVEVTEATAEHGTQVRAAIGASVRPIKAWYFKLKDGERRALVMVPHGQITERGEIPLTALRGRHPPGDALHLPGCGRQLDLYLHRRRRGRSA